MYPADLAAVRRAAQVSGVPTAVWVRRTLRTEADKVLRVEQERLALTAGASDVKPSPASDVVLDFPLTGRDSPPP